MHLQMRWSVDVPPPDNEAPKAAAQAMKSTIALDAKAVPTATRTRSAVVVAYVFLGMILGSTLVIACLWLDKHVRVRWQEHRARKFAEERIAGKAWISENFMPVKLREKEVTADAPIVSIEKVDKVLVLESLPVIEKDPMCDEEEPEAECGNVSGDESLYPASM